MIQRSDEPDVFIIPAYTHIPPRGMRVSDESLTLQAGIDQIPRPWMEEGEEESEGGGVPEGYVETEVILCQNGSPVSGTILFKEDA